MKSSTTTSKSSTSTAKKSSATASKAKDSTKTASKSTTTTGGKVKPAKSAAEGLKELFEDQLKDILWAEKALTKALPKMAKNATSETLSTTLLDHLATTEEQIVRLQKAFEIFGKKAVAKKCEAMEGLIKEGQEILEETEPGPVRDAGIIAASQKIEHYEIATYGTLVAHAKTLGQNEIASLLEETLREEKEADALLTDAAYNSINFEAAEADKE
ncbi:MAG TPA: ferritin-like domain-containing protein [Flavobacterium sp.]|jgi:ferritin-like metal-binding protein YciE